MTTQSQQDQRPAAQAQQAWQDGLTALLDGYTRQAVQLANFWGFGIDPQQVGETVRRVNEGARDVMTAQMAVAREWLQAPYWGVGLASPQGLQQSYTQLLEAYGRLFSAFTAAAQPLQRAALQTSARVNDAARAMIDTQARTVGTVTRDLTEAQAAATEAAVETGRRVTRQTAEAVEQAAEATAEARERAAADARRAAQREEQEREREAQRLEQEREREAQRVEREREREREAARNERERGAQREEREPDRHAHHNGRGAHNGRVIKGNISKDGEKIYHIPGQSSYERTQADEVFHSEEEAQAAGFRRAETPGGGRIKGHVGSGGEKIYHLPDQANYDRLNADFLFETEEQAEAEGFRAARR